MAFTPTVLPFLSGGGNGQAFCVGDNNLLIGGISDDGSSHNWPVYWDSGNAVHQLNSAHAGAGNTVLGISQDGNLMVGATDDGTGGSAPSAWATPFSSAPTLLTQPAGNPGGQLTCCSHNGGIIFGNCATVSGGAFVWVGVGGSPVALPTTGAFDVTAVFGCSLDGTKAFGLLQNTGTGAFSAALWTGGPSFAVTQLAELSGGTVATAADGSDNGTIIVGTASDASFTLNPATFWNPSIHALTPPQVGVAASANSCDALGTTIVGQASTTPQALATVWASGTPTTLPLPGGYTGGSNAFQISRDTTVVAGVAVDGASVQHPMKWTQAAPPPTGLPLVWFRLNNGSWLPSGDPAAGTGGISLSPLSGQKLYLTVQGTGDAGITINAGGSSFGFTPPVGFTHGLPASAGGFTTLDPSKLLGSAALGGGNLQAGFSGSPGLAQTVDGYNSGRYYCELVNPTGDIFSADWGGGFGIDYQGGGDLNHWINNGSYNSGDTNGGALVGGQTLVHELSQLFSLGATIASDVFDFAINSGDIVGIALAINDAPPPPPTPTPAVVVPVSLGRWRGQVGINWNGLALVGDAFSNVVGVSDFTSFNEYGNQIRMLATAPPLHEDRKRIFVSRFEVEVEAGEGIPGAPQTAPQLMLDYSKDGGITFVPLQVFRSMGAAGEYIKRLRWINLGQSRTWIFRIQYSDAARPSIIGTYVDYWKGLG